MREPDHEKGTARQEAEPEPIGEVLSSVERILSVSCDAPAFEAIKAAWYRANGVVEREHTTGIYVVEPKREGELPALVVYVDTKAREVDFRANREIYLDRMEHVGIRLKEIRFKLDGRPAEHRKQKEDQAINEPIPLKELPELDDGKKQTLLSRCQTLPPELRDVVFRALEASARREMNS